MIFNWEIEAAIYNSEVEIGGDFKGDEEKMVSDITGWKDGSCYL